MRVVEMKVNSVTRISSMQFVVEGTDHKSQSITLVYDGVIPPAPIKGAIYRLFGKYLGEVFHATHYDELDVSMKRSVAIAFAHRFRKCIDDARMRT
ncbi:hypothetical protein BCS95_11840 [Vibrio breoganii]|nr:hypothetical protein BCS95_11840 [Vibrio breoganii]